MRRLLPAALAAALAMPVSAHSRDLTVSLDWDVASGPSAEIALVLLDGTGTILAAQHLPVAPDDEQLSLSFPVVPRQAVSVQAGLFERGVIHAQTAPVVLEPGLSEISATLEPLLALGFHTRWLCADGTHIKLAPDGDGLRMTSPPPVKRFVPVADVTPDADSPGTALVAPDGARLHEQDARMVLTLPGSSATICAPVPFPPVLPVTARAESEQGWQIDLTLAGAMLDIPALPHDPERKVELVARHSADGTLRFETEELALKLVDQQCRFRTATVPYPITALLTLSDEHRPSRGCAGDPLALLAGGSWLVTSIFNAPIDPTQPDMPELTMEFAGKQIAGRAACNRYVGVAAITEERLVISDLGTTRLTCPVALQNLELRFLDALEQATGFDLITPDQLILRTGAVSVLTAQRR